ncbi:MAG: histidine phosphatase family protein, partial [Chloroflexi bacterium]|nr:histidine phosphatase family protein [Chloroflexota bacterium]
MQLYFIRHAQSLNNHLWDQTGDSTGRSEDPELTPTGWKQAELLAAFVSRSAARAVWRWADATPTDFDPATGVNTPPLTWGQLTHNVQGFGLTHIYA